MKDVPTYVQTVTEYTLEKNCKNQKVMWIHYIKRFIANNEKLNADWYGCYKSV